MEYAIGIKSCSCRTIATPGSLSPATAILA